MVERFRFAPGIYARIREAQMNERDREAAIAAMEQAERFAVMLWWIKGWIDSFGRSLLEPATSGSSKPAPPRFRYGRDRSAPQWPLTRCTDRKEKRMQRPDTEIPAPDTLFAAALYLAAKYARTGCPLLCRMVVRQLACIERHPDEAIPRSLRETCRKLSAEWERIGIERTRALREAAVANGRGGHLLH